MEKLVLIALIGSVTAVQMRSVRQEYAILIGGTTAVLLLAEGLLQFSGLSEAFSRLCSNCGVSPAVLASALKILGIAHLTDFGVNVSKDAGQMTIAGALETGGRVLMISCALPAVVTMVETGTAMIREAMP